MNPEPAIVDTSIYISLLREGRFEKELLGLPLLVRFSSVVIAELLRGARSKRARRIIHELYRGCALINPSSGIWTEAGEILSVMALRKHYDANKLRELHFDVLIALSARSVGAYVITANADDFQAIKKFQEFKLIVWR